jgi:hypothetical protein
VKALSSASDTIQGSVLESIPEIDTRVETASWFDLPDYGRGGRFRIPVLVFSDGVTTVVPQKPIVVTLDQEDDMFVAEHGLLDIYACGQSFEAALSGFHQHLIEFYKHYRDISDDRVVGEAVRLKREYQRIFSEKE